MATGGREGVCGREGAAGREREGGCRVKFGRGGGARRADCVGGGTGSERTRAGGGAAGTARFFGAGFGWAAAVFGGGGGGVSTRDAGALSRVADFVPLSDFSDFSSLSDFLGFDSVLDALDSPSDALGVDPLPDFLGFDAAAFFFGGAVDVVWRRMISSVYLAFSRSAISVSAALFRSSTLPITGASGTLETSGNGLSPPGISGASSSAFLASSLALSSFTQSRKLLYHSTGLPLSSTVEHACRVASRTAAAKMAPM